uniref:Uncharacterized protein n=1 Tax=Glypta fumiferanae TaxID=389681 RepID=A0A0F6QAC3_9HYME|nr:hypothetical protein [Glypta fumiferanae]
MSEEKINSTRYIKFLVISRCVLYLSQKPTFVSLQPSFLAVYEIARPKPFMIYHSSVDKALMYMRHSRLYFSMHKTLEIDADFFFHNFSIAITDIDHSRSIWMRNLKNMFRNIITSSKMTLTFF